jgi:two-component system, NarL family, sensor kinase
MNYIYEKEALREVYLFRILFFIALLVGASAAAGQNKKIQDSLFAIAYKQPPDTNSIRAYQAIQRNFFNTGLYDSALLYAHKAVSIAQEINHPKELANAWYSVGLASTNLHRYDTAKRYIALAQTSAIELSDLFLLANCYNTLSMMSRYEADYDASLTYALKSAAIAEHSTDSGIIKLLPKIYYNISAVLTGEYQFEKAIGYLKNALRFKNYPDEQRYRILLHLSVVENYINLKKLDPAKPHLDTAVALAANFDNIVLKILTASSEGFYYDQTKKYDEALSAYHLSYQYASQNNSTYLKAEAASNLADVYYKQKRYIEAAQFASEANKLAFTVNHLKMIAGTFSILKEIAHINGNYKDALQYAELYKLYSDSSTNEATQKVTLSLETRYQTEKKEKEIADLTISNTLKELEVVKRNRLLIIGGLLASLLMIALGLLYRNSQQKRIIAEKDKMFQQEQIKFLERQQQVVSLQSMVNGQETERTRIAKDLHDGLGGLFSTVKMHFSTLHHEQKQLQTDPLFSKSYELIKTASEEVRRIAHNMMPEVLLKIGVIQATRELCNSISAGKLLKVSLQAYGMEKRLNASTEIMLYRIIQELLNNIIKHADATEAIVQFNRAGNCLSVTVEDNGRGFSMNEGDEKITAGLSSVKSRVQYLNGQLSIDSQTEIGTTVLMNFLIDDEQVK